MEAAYSILLLFAVVFLVGETIQQQLRRDKRNLIIGGKQISISEAPYQAALLVNGGFFCGGSIIGSKWILTAGHCISDKVDETLSVRVGSNLRYAGGVEVKVLQAIRHPSYRKDTSSIVYSDIGLLLLEEPLQFDGSRVSCVSLPAQGEKLQAGATGKVAGWGKTRKFRDSPASLSVDTLLAVDTTVLPFEECQRAYADYYMHEETQYCMGDLKDDKGACKGDSGGPFIVGKTVYGVVSWSKQCTEVGSPAIFTNVGAYVQWIQYTVASVSSPEDLVCN
ncbi:trypsin-1-like [Sabethes cyaneus]|uniref:trypsin-1-like n=1 Tax=Sabethes cyaneus TaxID=53552 RepID=UPI00237EB120|nr:trypsin-1-like [Sabethes cyaneus]